MGRGGKFSVRPNNQTPPSFLYHPVIPAKETVQKTLARLRWRKTQPPKSPLSGGLSTQFPPDKGGKGG